MARLFFLLTALVLGLSSSSALACDGCGGLGYGFGLGYMYNSLDYRVPYFAAHPPVYYSYPVPRTYGYSPWAYPPNVRTPEVVFEPQPLTITNPHVDASSLEAKASVDQTTKAEPQSPGMQAPEPLVIENPFVKSSKVMTASHAL